MCNRAALVAALEDMGFKDRVEVHDKATNLKGYQNDTRPDLANVILRRRDVGGASNDIGFVLRNDGTYEAIISEYDRGNGACRKNDLSREFSGYNNKWLDRLQQHYSKHVIRTKAAELGYAMTEKVIDGKIIVTCDAGF